MRRCLTKLFLPMMLITLFILTSCSTTIGKTKNEERAELYFTKATNHLMLKQYTDALISYLEAIKLDPKSTHIHNNLGLTYFFKKQNAKARTHFRKAIDLDPDNFDALNNLASLYFTENKYSKAKKIYTTVSEKLTYRKQYKTFYNLGLIELKAKNQMKAAQMFEKSIEENKNYCPAHYQLGMVSKSFGAYPKAKLSFLNSIRGTCYNNAASHYELGNSYLFLKDYARAQDKFEFVLKNHPSTRYGALSQIKLSEIKQKVDYTEVMEASNIGIKKLNRFNFSKDF
jgi:Tfp pilus assembly protein PilF